MGFFDTLNIKCINELAIREKRVFLRTDFNFPTDKSGNVIDFDRIQQTLPTIRHAVDHNARLVVVSHLGRPDSNRESGYTLEPIAAKLAEALEKEIYFFEDCVGMGAFQMIRDLKPGQILVWENLRFNEEEKKNSTIFARELAKMCDVYINDAFGVSHRKDASIASLPLFIDTKGVGFAMKKEIEELSKFLDYARKDHFYALIGGYKVSEKIGLIKPLIETVDKILLGGLMANIFLAAKGVKFDTLAVEEKNISTAKEILKRAEVRGVEIVLPVDLVAAETSNSTEFQTCSVENFPEGMVAVDIGPKSVELFTKVLADCRHLFWSGPMGIFEKEQFASGSVTLAHEIVKMPFHKVVGGGATLFLVKKARVSDKFDHVSAGGTASLEFLKNRGMIPGIAALKY